MRRDIIVGAVALAIGLLVGWGGETKAFEFPELRPVAKLPPGYTWSFQDGPDFYIYRAKRESEDLPLIGIYFGLHPTFHPSGEKESGTVANRAVKWSSSSEKGQLKQDCLLPYRHSKQHIELQVHVWVIGRAHSELSQLKDVLRTVQFEQSHRVSAGQ